MRPPTITRAALSAIAITGFVFATTAIVGGSPIAGIGFLTLPLCALSCARTWRNSRTALFLISFIAMLPLMIGIGLTWPDIVGAAPYLAGVAALVLGLAGMLTKSAREWYASAKAHRLLDL